MNEQIKGIDRIFYPKSVAIFGVSENLDNLGQFILRNMIDNKYTGKVYLIGRKEGEINGMRIYKSINDVQDSIDLAVMLTPAQLIPELLKDCVKRGIEYAVIESGGFSETNDQGRMLEQDIKKIAETYNIRFTGPNGLGVINMENGLCTPFFPVVPPIKKGGVSIISQSGGMSLMIMQMLNYECVGINKVISAGNKANIDEIEYLSYLMNDPGTKIIAMYLEDIKNGAGLIDLIQKCDKPVVVFKSNINAKTAQLAQSHASAIANDDAVVTEALKEAGAIRVDTLTELTDVVKLLSITNNYGNRIAVLSRSGGHAIITDDAAVQYGFETPKFSEKFLQEVGKHVRAGVINFTNPLDMGDIYDFDFYIKAVELALSDPSFDIVVFIHTYSSAIYEGSSDDMIKRFTELTRTYKKPILPLFFTEADNLIKLMKSVDYPFFIDPATMLRAVAKIRDASSYKRKLNILSKPYNVGSFQQKIRNTLSLMGSLNVVQFHGIPTAPWAYARSQAEVKDVIKEFGYPIAMKIESMNVSHKSDIGGVILDINNETKALEAYDWLTDGIKKGHPNIATDGVVIQKMLKGPMELIISAKRDKEFGPVIITGIGGIYTEILKDISIALCPIDETYAIGMLERLKGYTLLKGARGQKPLATEEAAQIISMVSKMMIDRFNIIELDLNPVLLDEEKALALDARVIVEKMI